MSFSLRRIFLLGPGLTWLVLFLVIRTVNRMKREEEAPAAEPTTKECPHCLSAVPLGATRCAFCTSDLS